MRDCRGELSDRAAEISNPVELVKEPLVSVLMLAFNHANYITQAIESVLSQKTSFHFELLIGEDCSTDETRAIILDFQRRNPSIIRVVSSNANVGMHNNHARLVQDARGEMLAYCEGDDAWIDASKLEKQVSFLREHPECGAVHTEFSHLVRSRGKWRSLSRHNMRMNRVVPEGMVFHLLLRGNFIQTCTFCVRAELARDYFATDLPIASYPVGDWPLFLYVASRSSIGYLPEPTGVYRQNPGSMMNSGHQVRLKIVQGYIPMIEDFCDRYQVPEAVRRCAIKGLWRTIPSLSVLACERESFRAAWAWLELHDPDFLQPMRRRALPWLVRMPGACRALAAIHDLRTAVRQMYHYRSPTPAVH